MIEITLVAGPSGSGKTAWISRKLVSEAAAGFSACVAVAVAPADGADGDAKRTREDLCRRLSSIAGSAHAASGSGAEPPERVFVESHYSPDVRTIVSLISEQPVLQANFALTELVVVINAVDGVERLHGDERLRFSVSLADTLVIAGADIASRNQIATLAATMRWLNPTAVIVCTAHGRDTGSPVPGKAMGDAAWAAGPPWGDNPWLRPMAQTMELSADILWPQFALWLDAVNRAHANQALKINGVVHTPNGLLALRSFGGVLARILPVRPGMTQHDGAASTLAFTSQGLDPSLLPRSLAAFVPSSS